MGFVVLVIVLGVIMSALGFVIFSQSNRIQALDSYISENIDYKHTLDKVERVALDSRDTEPLLADMVLGIINNDRKAL